MSHYIELCQICGDVISQCRCPSPDKEKRFGVCKKCQGATEDHLNKVMRDKPTPKEYIDAAMGRISDFSKGANEALGPFTLTAINRELKTMFDVGKRYETENR